MLDIDGLLNTEMVRTRQGPAVTHSSTNRAQRRATALIETRALLLHFFLQCFVTVGWVI